MTLTGSQLKIRTREYRCAIERAARGSTGAAVIYGLRRVSVNSGRSLARSVECIEFQFFRLPLSGGASLCKNEPHRAGIPSTYVAPLVLSLFLLLPPS